MKAAASVVVCSLWSITLLVVSNGEFIGQDARCVASYTTPAVVTSPLLLHLLPQYAPAPVSAWSLLPTCSTP